MGSLPLHDVVVHHQYLLIVVLAGDCMGYLHDVHKLVYHDNEALVARADEKRRQQLDVVVPVVVGDNDVYAEILLGLGLGGVLSAQPPYGAGSLLVVSGGERLVVGVDDPREIEAVNHVLKTADFGVDLLFNCGVEERIVGAGSGGDHLGADIGYPLLKYERERASVGLCADAHIAHELPVGRETLTLRAHQAALRGEVGVGGDEPSVHKVLAHGLKHEALSASVSSDDEAEKCAAFLGDVHVVEKRVYLRSTSDRDVSKPCARNYAALQRVYYSGSYSLWYCNCHIPSTSSI